MELMMVGWVCFRYTFLFHTYDASGADILYVCLVYMLDILSRTKIICLMSFLFKIYVVESFLCAVNIMQQNHVQPYPNPRVYIVWKNALLKNKKKNVGYKNTCLIKTSLIHTLSFNELISICVKHNLQIIV